MNRDNLIKQITKKSIENHSMPLWFPKLANELVKVGEKIIKEDFGLRLSEYGTNRIWHKNKTAPRKIITTYQYPLLSFSNFDSIIIENLDERIVKIYKDQGVDFYESYEVINTSIIDCIDEAIKILTMTPSMLNTIFTLVRSMHLINLEDNDYDVSFSEPHIPFSIFFSVPSQRVKNDYLRVAEAIIHEAMHLQLTLIEKVVPLVVKSENKYYSPWKNENRTVQGVLHALYVFRVLDSFFGEIINLDVLSMADKEFLHQRKQTIISQVIKIRDFVYCPDLTPKGKSLVIKLLFNGS